MEMIILKKTIRFVVSLIALGLCGAYAQAQGTDIEMMAKFKALYPNTTITDVKPSPIKGIWEVRMREQVAYTDETGRYLLFGALFDSKTQTDLSARRPAEQVKPVTAVFPKASIDNAIKSVKGDGSRVVAVFTDPRCPYCRSLESELAKLDNVTIYTFLYPVVSRESRTDSEAIWCSSSPQKSLRSVMAGSIAASQSGLKKGCIAPIDSNIALAQSMNIRATPALVSLDGRLKVGAAPAEQLNAWLNEGLTK
jgi:thiol:disulfide interchange protein DsbC